MTEQELYEEAIRKWGRTSQMFMVLEEMAELQVEICKSFRHGIAHNIDKLSEEIADLEIMLAQLKVISKNETLVENWKKKKLIRLEQRMKRT